MNPSTGFFYQTQSKAKRGVPVGQDMERFLTNRVRNRFSIESLISHVEINIIKKSSIDKYSRLLASIEEKLRSIQRSN